MLPAALIQEVKKVGAKSGLSFFTMLLSAFEATAARLSATDEVIVGIPAAGQPALGLDAVVGHCVNTLALRSGLDPKKSFLDFAKGVRKTMLDALQHQHFTFGTLLEQLPLPRDPSRLPLVSVLFNVDQAAERSRAPIRGPRGRIRGDPAPVRELRPLRERRGVERPGHARVPVQRRPVRRRERPALDGVLRDTVGGCRGLTAAIAGRAPAPSSGTALGDGEVEPDGSGVREGRAGCRSGCTRRRRRRRTPSLCPSMASPSPTPSSPRASGACLVT